MSAPIETLSTTSPSEASARSKFVLRYGALGWGITTGLIFALVMDFTAEPPASLTARLVSVAISLIVFVLAGIVWGQLMWWFLKRFGARAKAE